MKLLSLTSDFVFKKLFSENPDLLLSLLNSFPNFSGEKSIKEIKILNPEISRDIFDDKLSILDILAEDQNGYKFHIEMQGFFHQNYQERILYYWSKLYSRVIKKGEKYKSLRKVISISFLNFNIFKNQEEVHSIYKVLNIYKPEICLTEDLEIHTIELKKFHKQIKDLHGSFDSWLYTLKEAATIKGESMKSLTANNPTIKKALAELKILSRDKKNRELYEMKMKGLSDYRSDIEGYYEDGIQKGKEEGIKIGEEKGIKLEKQKIAQSMLSENCDMKLIVKVTGLTVKEIRALKKKSLT